VELHTDTLTRKGQRNVRRRLSIGAHQLLQQPRPLGFPEPLILLDGDRLNLPGWLVEIQAAGGRVGLRSAGVCPRRRSFAALLETPDVVSVLATRQSAAVVLPD
jgi:hypothetical protein